MNPSNNEDPSEKISSKDACKGLLKNHWRGFFAFAIPLVWLPIMLIDSSLKIRCVWQVAVVASYWISEIIPLYITGLLPVVLMPLLGVLSSEEVCLQVFKEPLLMFFAGLIAALAFEYSNLHTRIALGTIMVVGVKPRRLHAGLFMVTFFISMWISNSACAAMMCPVIKAVMDELGSQGMLKTYMDLPPGAPKDEKPHPSRIALAYYFGVCYAATIGGGATLIGTGTNLTFKGLYETWFPDATDVINFPLFMAYNAPLTLILALVVLFWLQVAYLGFMRRKSKIAQDIAKASENTDSVKAILKEKYNELGPISCHEIQVLVVFIVMVCLMFTLNPGFMTGWSLIIPGAAQIGSSLPAILCVLFLFSLPIHYGCCRLCFVKPPYPDNATPSCLSWKFTNDNAPWGLIFLIGGGYALAEGSLKSGMAKWLGEHLSGLKVLPAPAIIAIIVFIAIALTNFSSNVAICNIIIPVVIEMAIASKLHPLLLVYPAGVGTNMAFFLPVGTPPNAIVAGYAQIKTKYFAAAGIGPSVAGYVLIVINALTWARVVYPNLSEFPDWAAKGNF